MAKRARENARELSHDDDHEGGEMMKKCAVRRASACIMDPLPPSPSHE
jgi:hypothetical protein